MPFQVNITSITGTPLFNIWVCDTSGATNTCVFIKSTNSNSTTFELPQEFETTSQYCVKIIDSFQCESYKCFGSFEVSEQDNTYQFLSGASENVLILRKDTHTINANIGDYVSGTTYPAIGKPAKAFSSSLTWELVWPPYQSTHYAYNKNGQLVEFPKDIYKLISFDEFKVTPNGQCNQFMCLLPRLDNSGNTINYNFTTVPEQDLEIDSFSGTVKIRLDVSKAAADSGTSYEDVNESFILNAAIIEDFYNDSDLNFNVEVDVFLQTGTTFYDDLNINTYQDYHESNGGIFENTGYHLGGIIGTNTTGNAALLGGNYFQIRALPFYMANNYGKWRTLTHEIGHCFGLKHSFARLYRYMPGQEDGYWSQSHSRKRSDIFPLSGYPKGDYLSTKSSDKFNANERFSIMAYESNSFVGDGSAENAASALRVYPRVGVSPFSPNYGIRFDYSYKTNNGTSPSYMQGNINYIDYIDDGTFNVGELTAVTCNFELKADYYGPDINDVSLTGYGISNTGYTINMFEIDGNSLTENFSAYSFTISGQNLNNLFDYDRQSDFGVRFQVKVGDDNRYRIALNWDITLDFYSSGGTNDILNLKPRELFTVSYTDDSLSQIEEKYLSSGYILNSFVRDTLTPYEVRIVKSYADRLKNYFSE